MMMKRTSGSLYYNSIWINLKCEGMHNYTVFALEVS
jgi:hypothetical protein